MPRGFTWTDFVEHATTQVIYVDATLGSDSYNGLSGTVDGGVVGPKKTLAAAKGALRNGYPDWMLLKRGETWTGETADFRNVSGLSSEFPVRVGAYGTGARPIIENGGLSTNSNATSLNYIAFTDLHFTRTSANDGYSTAISMLHGGTGVLLENLTLESCGISIQGYAGQLTSVTLRGCVVSYAYAIGSHQQGAFFLNVDDLLIEGCVFDHNGWKDIDPVTATQVTGLSVDSASSEIRRASGSFVTDGYTTETGVTTAGFANGANNDDFEVTNVTATALTVTGSLVDEAENGSATANDARRATIYNHNIYVSYDCFGLTIRNTIMARPSSHGSQMRQGGTNEDNLYIDCPVAMNLGYWDTGVYEPEIGPNATVRRTCIMGTADIGGLPRGIGIQTDQVGTVSIYDCLLAHGTNGNQCRGLLITENALDLSINNCVIYQFDVPGADQTSVAVEVTNNGGENVKLSLTNTEIQQSEDWIISVYAAPSGGQTYSGNAYYSPDAESGWMYYIGTGYDVSGWSAQTGDSGSTNTQTSFTDATRTVATYHGSIGETATQDAFLTAARAQERDAWDDRYEPVVVNAWLRAGYDLSTTGARSLGLVAGSTILMLSY